MSKDFKIGDRCNNDHFPNRFTCPNCYADHELSAGEEGTTITCDCGATLRCQVELIESAQCTIIDPNEED